MKSIQDRFFGGSGRPHWPDLLCYVCGGAEPGGPMAGRQEEVEPIRRPAGRDCS